MTQKDQLTTNLTSVAEAIRSKTGGGSKLTIPQMAEAVEGIQIGTANIQTGSFSLYTDRNKRVSKTYTYSKPFKNNSYHIVVNGVPQYGSFRRDITGSTFKSVNTYNSIYAGGSTTTSSLTIEAYSSSTNSIVPSNTYVNMSFEAWGS